MPQPSTTRLPPWTPQQERTANVFIRWMTLVNVWAYKLTGGWLGGTFLRGAPVCIVTTIGKKTGEPRPIALLYLEDGPNVVVVASKGGMANHPAWYHNMMANPRVEVTIGRTTRVLQARRATDDEKAALWPKLVAMYRDYEDYQGRTTRNIPVMILS